MYGSVYTQLQIGSCQRKINKESKKMQTNTLPCKVKKNMLKMEFF